jgi:hypothetical protein
MQKDLQVNADAKKPKLALVAKYNSSQFVSLFNGLFG